MCIVDALGSLTYSVRLHFDNFVTDVSYLHILVFFQAEDGIRDLVRSRGLGDVYKRQTLAYPYPGRSTK